MYKRKPGYVLKKGKSGERRWHKKESAPRFKTKKSGLVEGKTDVALAKKLFPGAIQSSVRSPEDLALNTKPEDFYGKAFFMPSDSAIREGRPFDVMYHGTRAQFDNFAETPFEREFSSKTAHWNNGFGNHFTPQKEVADDFTKGRNPDENGWPLRVFDDRSRLIPVHLSVNRPLVFNSERDMGDLMSLHMIRTLSGKDKEKYLALYGDQLIDAELMDYMDDPRIPLIDVWRAFKGKTSPEDAQAYMDEKDYEKKRKLYERFYERDKKRKEFRVDTPNGVIDRIFDWENDGSKTSGAFKGVRSGDASGSPILPKLSYERVIRESVKFRDYIRSLGFDSMIYRNKQEGGIGIIPFSAASQIKIIGDRRKDAPSPQELLADGVKGKYAEEHKEFLKEVESHFKGEGEIKERGYKPIDHDDPYNPPSRSDVRSPLIRRALDIRNLIGRSDDGWGGKPHVFVAQLEDAQKKRDAFLDDLMYAKAIDRSEK